MALSQLYTAVVGHIITAARWNNEFGNIYTNGTDVSFPLTKAVSLAGWTLTLDAAGVTTVSSSATTGFSLVSGSKSGTPGVNGNIINVTAATITDTNTAAAGTAALFTAITLRRPTLAATNVTVTTTDAATFYIENAPLAGTNETITNPYAIIVAAGNTKLGGDLLVSVSDARTATVDAPVTITSVTSGAPAADIGTGILFQAESADENPSNVGQAEFAFSDIGAGTEDSYFQILLRLAGAALTSCYRFVATGAFNAIVTHANTAARTYTLPDRSFTFGAAELYNGPSSIAAGSTQSHEGTVTISGNQALEGVHYYTSFTLDAGITITLANDSDRLIIVATNTITINGTIDAIGAGGTGGSGGTAGVAGSVGQAGFSQTGGGGGAGITGGGVGGASGAVQVHGIVRIAAGTGGAISAGAGGTGGTQTGDTAMYDVYTMMGGAGGGGGGGGDTAGETGGDGGRGGGSIVLIAPTIVLGAASVFNTTGGAGAVGSNESGGGGGGGAGNIFIKCNSFTDNGATFTQTGGAGGLGGAGGGNGASGRAGIRQINIYA